MYALQINRTRTIQVLPTADVKVRSQNGRIYHLRALVDNCAQMNVITLQAMHRLGIKLTEAPERIIGVNQKNAMSTHGQMNLTILLKSVKIFKLSYVVLENITVHEHLNTQIAATELRKVMCIRNIDQTTTYGPDGRAMLRLRINKSQGIYDEITVNDCPILVTQHAKLPSNSFLMKGSYDGTVKPRTNITTSFTR